MNDFLEVFFFLPLWQIAFAKSIQPKADLLDFKIGFIDGGNCNLIAIVIQVNAKYTPVDCLALGFE